MFSRTPYVFDGHWVSVGDMARRDTDGYIHLVDRMSCTIIGGAKNICLSKVEGVIGAFPKVKNAAVIGVPHVKRGEAMMAIVTAATS